MVARANQDLGCQVKPLTPDEWVALLEAAGLREVVANTHAIDTREEARGILDRYGRGGMLRVFRRMVSLYAKNANYRKFVRGLARKASRPTPWQSTSVTASTSARSDAHTA